MTIIKPGDIIRGELLGEGGFGQVYEAQQYPLAFPLAIKLFKPSAFQGNPEVSLDRFFQEAEILLSLRHPNITPIYGFGEYEGSPYILMERFDGLDLQKALKIGIPTPKQILPFITKASDALQYAHEHPSKPVVHRDIKPSNLLTKIGDMRVVDFGIAKLLDPDYKQLTIDGETPQGGSYADPILTKNPRLADPICDIYSLGACWFYILTGVPPQGHNIDQHLKQISGISAEYRSVILKCLSEPEKRYQSMLELKNEVILLSSDNTPNAVLDDSLDENSILLISAIFERYEPMKNAASYWDLQRALANNLNDFQFSMSLNKLRTRNFIEDEEITDLQGYSQEKGASMTLSGIEWIHRHEEVISALHKRVSNANTPSTEPSFDDDIPF